MEQYIPKAAVVAEIERKINTIGIPRDKIEGGVLYELGNLQDFINTLEVKEVDLDKEIDLVEDKYYGFESLSRADIIEIIKHFFELGLKAQKGE